MKIFSEPGTDEPIIPANDGPCYGQPVPLGYPGPANDNEGGITAQWLQGDRCITASFFTASYPKEYVVTPQCASQYSWGFNTPSIEIQNGNLPKHSQVNALWYRKKVPMCYVVYCCLQ